MKPEKDNTFCYFPFSQLALKNWWKDSGITSAAQCCNAIRPENNNDPLNLNDELYNSSPTATEIFNSGIMNELRQSMINGERHTACDVCWKTEDTGGNSYRMFSNPPYSYSTNEVFDHNEPKLQVIDFGFGENCNLRCRMCHPGLSNKLRKDYKYFVDNNVDTAGVYGWDHNLQEDNSMHEIYASQTGHTDVYGFDRNHQWQDILDNIHNLRSIKATGGETTLTEGFKELVDHALATGANKNMTLEFHTNATKFTNDLVSKMLEFEYCHVSLSIDATDKAYEYIRYPMKWQVLKNSVNNLITKWHDHFEDKTYSKEIALDLTCVFSVYNAHMLHDLFEWWNDTCNNKPLIKTSFYIDKMWPDDKFTAVHNLSKKQKLEILDVLYKIDNYNMPNVSVTHIIEYVKNSLALTITDAHRKNMLKEITAFDLSRGEFYGDFVHPSIVEYLETPIKD
mgnify:FL=1